LTAFGAHTAAAVNQNSTRAERSRHGRRRYSVCMRMRALALALTLFSTLSLFPHTERAALAAPGDVPSVTDPRYFVGVNVPWFNWGCDFGCGEASGVRAPAVNAALKEGFGRLKTAGVHTVRWWTFEGDPTQITRDASGAPTGLNPAIYGDFDAALALAEQYDLAYVFVLFSGPTAVPRAWMVDPDQRQKLAAALAPLFERYKNHPRILAWEFINEPEYDIWGGSIPVAAVQETVKLLASTVHAHTATAVTVGAATLEGVPLWQGLGLDFHSPHWYDQMDKGLMCARCVDVPTLRSSYRFDNLPIVIGEFYGGPDVDTLQRFTDFRAKGYAGGWTWSLFFDKTMDLKQTDLAAITRFNAAPPPVPAAAAAGPSAPSAPAGLLPATPAVQLLANWVSPTYVLPGQSITFHQDVMSSRDGSFVVGFEVYDSQGQKVSQSTLASPALGLRERASLSTTLLLPMSLPPGRYTVKTGAFSSDLATQYAASDLAGVFVVEPLPTPPPDAVQEQVEPEPGVSEN
jgi:hypothetical protein